MKTEPPGKGPGAPDWQTLASEQAFPEVALYPRAAKKSWDWMSPRPRGHERATRSDGIPPSITAARSDKRVRIPGWLVPGRWADGQECRQEAQETHTQQYMSRRGPAKLVKSGAP